jgi:hypothetical protein
MTMIASKPKPDVDRTPGPNDLIESMTGRRYLSWSQLNAYRGCPRRWFYSHVEHLEPEFVNAALLLGSAFHTAAQHHYEQQLIGQPVSLEQLTDMFHQAFTEEAGDAEVRYGKNDDEQSVKDTGVRMLKAFTKSELATLPGSVIAIEETLAGQLDPRLPDLLMRIDVAWQADDGVHLMDLKTSKSRWSAAKVDESAEQLLLYQTLASQLVPDQPLQLHFGIVTKAKTPAVQKLDVAGDTTRTSDVVDLMLPVWNAMRAGVDFASPSPMSCATCGYQSRCPAYRG